MDQNAKKRAAGRAALDLVEPGTFVGVGTGSTANHFIDALATRRDTLLGAVASSEASAARLRAHGIAVVGLAESGRLPLYVDGADEATAERMLIKGGGGALTREKVVAAASERFVCVVDDSKLVSLLGRFPLALEVVEMALPHVAAEIGRLGGSAERRAGFLTDNGNPILDVRGLDFEDPPALESALDGIAGVVTCGLFARRPADLLLVAGPDGVRRI